MIFPVPPPKPLIHPRLDQVESRKREILMWDLEHRKRQEWLYAFYAAKRSRMAVHAILVACCFLASMFFGALGNPVAALVMLVLLVITSAAAIRARNMCPDQYLLPEKPRPEPLHVVEYSKWENDYLISRQHEQKFTSECACPGCGNIAVHLISEQNSGVPWGNVTRQCRICRREWAQV